jgi:hypothetical protein
MPAVVYSDKQRKESNGIPGEMYVAWDIPDRKHPVTGRTYSSFEIKQRTFVHELGNILSYMLTKDYNYFASKNGVPHEFNKNDKPDYDTGAALEECVFGDMVP